MSRHARVERVDDTNIDFATGTNCMRFEARSPTRIEAHFCLRISCRMDFDKPHPGPAWAGQFIDDKSLLGASKSGCGHRGDEGPFLERVEFTFGLSNVVAMAAL